MVVVSREQLSAVLHVIQNQPGNTETNVPISVPADTFKNLRTTLNDAQSTLTSQGMLAAAQAVNQLSENLEAQNAFDLFTELGNSSAIELLDGEANFSEDELDLLFLSNEPNELYSSAHQNGEPAYKFDSEFDIADVRYLNSAISNGSFFDTQIGHYLNDNFIIEANDNLPTPDSEATNQFEDSGWTLSNPE